MKIVVPEYIEIIASKHLDELKSLGDVTLYPDFPKTDNEIIKRIHDAELVAVKWLKINKNILNNCNKLKYLIMLSIGINFVDYQAATTKGIKIINCPTHNSYAVAEHIIGLMFAASRHIPQAQNLVKKGVWKESPYSFSGTELLGKKLGLIGYGHIGKKVALLANNLGMKITYVNSKSSTQDLDKLLSTSDYISLSLPYSEKLYHYLDEKKLKLLKKTAFLINTARGELIDQKVLIRYLKEGKISGAGIDVFENEPINSKPSQEIVELANLSNVVATPHIGYNTKEAALRLGEEFIKNVKACLAGSPINSKN